MSVNFQKKIAQLQNNYYKDNTKCLLFKSNQKIDCANTISNAFNKNELFANTIYILSNTNKLYFDYTFFKTYATPPIFQSLVEYIYDLIKQTIQKYNSYEMHINWNTYTISAHDRYKELYSLFLNKYDNCEFNFHDNLNNLYVYYTPNVIQIISKLMAPIIHPVVLSKVTLFNKNESEELLNNLLNNK